MMASGVVVKTKRKGKFADNAVRYNEMSLRQNGAILDYCRTSMSSLSGAAAGILGLTGVQGFAFYFVTAFLLSVMLMFKAGGSWNKYFVTRRDLFISGLFGGIFTYILFWTYPFDVPKL